jgi:hypothetical protein
MTCKAGVTASSLEEGSSLIILNWKISELPACLEDASGMHGSSPDERTTYACYRKDVVFLPEFRTFF